jgi:glutamate dehydrogenase
MSAHNDVAHIIDRLQALARERRPDDALLVGFIGEYFREVPNDDANAQRLELAYAAALTHLHLGKVRRPGETLVQLLSPDLERDGWESERSILMFVTDDAPFLVDSVRMVLDRHELGIHLLVHPILVVERDDRGVLVDATGGTGLVEAWTLIEIDRGRAELRAQLEGEVRDAIENVQRAVGDFGAMQQRLRAVADGDPLLTWLADENFVFLGAATYHASPTGMRAIDGTLLGEYRSGRLDPDRIDPPLFDTGAPYAIARTDAVADVHRPARMTAISVRPGGAEGEMRFVGLLGSAAYRESAFAIPVIGERAAEVVTRVAGDAGGHTGRAVRNVIETLPRDVLFELDVEELTTLVESIVGLQERHIVRVFDVTEPVGPWTTVFVYVPRSRFTAALPDLVASLVTEHYGGDIRDLETFVGTSSLARLSMAVRAAPSARPARLGAIIDDASRTWGERARDALVEVLGEIEGHRVWSVVGPCVPADYEARVRPPSSVSDLIHVERMLSGTDDISTTFGRSIDETDENWRFRVFLRDRPATIAELVPILEHLGLSPVDERPYVFESDTAAIHLDDIGVEIGALEVSDEQHAEVQRAFIGLMEGDIEPDTLNRLVLAGGLDIDQIAVLRTYVRYLRQASFPFSTVYVSAALVRHPGIARALSELFDARFQPGAAHDDPVRVARCESIRADLLERLDAVPSLDDDRICRAVLTLIDATDRTSAFLHRPEVAVKLRPHDIAFLPAPRPEHEIFVCSPHVEGVHLRGGRIARGGLRWSDRPEDFRTEVLGLVKAQMVKNAVIVPTGAKGGFVIKGSTADPTDRDAVRSEGVDRYRRFVGALLDLTDNVVGDGVAHPPDVVRYDRDDPYLVVAADKGTATFSDIANEIAAERDFWLGDAFASGGSHGYDHKAMGITARGAWESVRRHARVIGKDVDRDELTVVGIGDMSGDVFGNGMLLSTHLRVVAAFDHRHIFLDPDPDPAAAHAERRRLFELPRSSWADYDAALISDGGGVHARILKSIAVTREVRRALDLPESITDMRPDELVSAILRAPVDLLWNGGIGTYVKASSESHADVGDRANDAVRVDGIELRALIVGEGGNLGLTQLGRVEYALRGGLIYTDAIDNSAGVDCSDHEVNLKVLLDQLVRDGDLTVRQRNELLVEMTDEVARLVLADNRAQTLALMIARTQSRSMVNVHARYLDTLESEGYLDRELEFLPTDKQIAERQSAGSGLRAPEFAVMMAYTKNADVTEVLTSDVPDDPALEADLMAYFPTQIRERFPAAIRGHRLRREIVATSVVNNMVNHAGISFDHRMTEDSGASVGDVTRAYVASRDIFGFADIWREIDDLGSAVSLETQVSLFLDARRMTERGTVWLLRHRRPPLDIGHAVDTFSAGLGFLAESLDQVVSDRVAERIAAVRDERVSAGVPPALAERSARWPWLHTAFDVVAVAHGQACNVADAAVSYWSVFDALELGWLWDSINDLPRSDRWQEQARSALRDELLTVLADLTSEVMRTDDGSTARWIRANDRAVNRALAMHTEIRRAESLDLTTLWVALRQLRNLVLTALPSSASSA